MIINSSTPIALLTSPVHKACIVVLIQRFRHAGQGYFLKVHEVHNLMYLLQEAGEPLQLKFVKTERGVYAEKLHQILQEANGQVLSIFASNYDVVPKEFVSLIFGALLDAGAFLIDKQETLSRLQCVSKLIVGFESPAGLKLLVTVHWAATRKGATRREVHNTLDKHFLKFQIVHTYDTLRAQKWLMKQENDHE